MLPRGWVLWVAGVLLLLLRSAVDTALAEPPCIDAPPIPAALASATTTSLHRSPIPAWAAGTAVYPHHGGHGQAYVERLVAAHAAAGVAVSAVVLDAFWHAPADLFRFNAALYPDPAGLAARLAASGARLVLWTTVHLPLHDASYPMALRRGWFLRGRDGPLVLRWRHGGDDGTLTDGSLLDVSHPDARRFLARRLGAALALCRAAGARLSGAAALLWEHHDVQGHRGHYDAAHYERDVHRTVLAIGRTAVGPDFAVVARTVGTHHRGGQHYRRYAPLDVAVAGWGGEHPASFAGLREAVFTAMHAGQRGYLSTGAGTAGGTPRASLRDDTAVHGEDTGAHRGAELRRRWLQAAALLPFFCVGDSGPLGLPLNPSIIAALRRAAADHAQLAPYITATVTAAFYHRLARWDHVSAAYAESGTPLASQWVVWPLSGPLHFAEPAVYGWWLGRELLALPSVRPVPNAMASLELPPWPTGAASVPAEPPRWYDPRDPRTTLEATATVRYPSDAALLLRRRDGALPLASGAGVAFSVDHPSPAAVVRGSAGATRMNVSRSDAGVAVTVAGAGAVHLRYTGPAVAACRCDSPCASMPLAQPGKRSALLTEEEKTWFARAAEAGACVAAVGPELLLLTVTAAASQRCVCS